MTRILIILIVALVLFSASAAASWFLQQQSLNHEEKGSEAKEKSARVLPGPAPGGEAKTPALRPPHVPEAENIAKMAASLQQQTEAIRQRDQQVTARQKNLEAIYQDLRQEQKSLDEFRKQIAEEMKLLGERVDAAEKKAGEARQEGQKAADQTREMKQVLLDIDDVEKGRLKQMASVYDSMDPEAAAQTFQEMVDTGKLDMAVKILASMRERQAARVLAQLPNHAVAVQLLDRLKGLRPPTKAQ